MNDDPFDQTLLDHFHVGNLGNNERDHILLQWTDAIDMSDLFYILLTPPLHFMSNLFYILLTPPLHLHHHSSIPSPF